MRRFLLCCGLEGREESLDHLEGAVQKHKPDAILFAGGIFSSAPRPDPPTAASQRHHEEMVYLEHFLDRLGNLNTFTALIPGPDDVPLRAILRAGVNAETTFPGVHMVHATLATNRDSVITGIGGELTLWQDSGDLRVQSSMTTAEYFLRMLQAADQPQKVLLLGQPPNGRLGGEMGNVLAGELIDSYHPRLAVTAGPTAHRGTERVAHTRIVNPGRLVDGSAAWIDWNRDVDHELEMLDLTAELVGNP